MTCTPSRGSRDGSSVRITGVSYNPWFGHSGFRFPALKAAAQQPGLEDAPCITEGLLRRGYAEQEIRGILGENWPQVCEEIWR